MPCWFCSVREAEAGHEMTCEMYGDIDATKSPSQTHIAYNVRHLAVPRCADCHSRHLIALYALSMAIILTIALLTGIAAAVFAWVNAPVWGIWTGLAAGLTLGALGIRFVALKGILSVGYARRAHPEIKELLDKCYRFGHKLRGKLPESSQPCDQDKQEEPAGHGRS